MSKGPDAFRTISEVAAELDLPQHVLRFWETRFTHIRPLKRGGGRRYYRPDDVDLLRGIRHLLYGEGYTIRGVQRILHEQGPRFVVSAGKGENPDLAPLVAINGDGADEAGMEPHLSAGLLPADPLTAERSPQDADEEDGVPPTFDPRAFRKASQDGDSDAEAAKHLSPRDDRLSEDEVRRLKSTLSELAELKRLLDEVR